MDRIPVSFNHAGKTFTGYFSWVAGAGETSVFHLMDSNNFYYGVLRFNGSWVFDGNRLGQDFAGYADYFGEVVMAWYQ